MRKGQVSCREEVKLIAVSIVSHGHGAMVEHLVDALLRNCPEVAEILVTKNIPESLSIAASNRVVVIDNRSPKGFGANHNASFQLTSQPFFCPLNPDIQIEENPFPDLISAMRRTNANLVAPLIKTPLGDLEDNIRLFPTPFSLLIKILGGSDGRYPPPLGQDEFHPDWVAGMFMLFRREGFDRLGGFDEDFYLYYEDVDICVRAWREGLIISACPNVCVKHDARRDSRHNMKLLCWHLMSMARFFWKHGLWHTQFLHERC